MHLEPGAGGRLFESIETSRGIKVVETGTVLIWEPPSRLVLEWRGVNFAKGEKTEIEVNFAKSPSGTLVTLVHRGFASLRPDHPVRHGAAAAAFTRAIGLWWGGLLTSLREAAEAKSPSPLL